MFIHKSLLTCQNSINNLSLALVFKAWENWGTITSLVPLYDIGEAVSEGLEKPQHARSFSPITQADCYFKRSQKTLTACQKSSK